MAKRGRPPKADKRLIRVQVSVSLEELEVLKQAASKDGLPLAPWMRNLSLRAAKSIEEEVPL